MSDRKCIGCGAGIEECMGFVLARDVLAFMQGKPVAAFREICGKCGLLRLEDRLGIRDLVPGA
ncbi:MAG: hypothetical protein JWN50_309 [Parcubacteria group bacterium]|nr:hypothetical protein [Parcubacteria group bacterium]